MSCGYVVGLNADKPVILKIIRYKGKMVVMDTYVSEVKECVK